MGSRWRHECGPSAEHFSPQIPSLSRSGAVSPFHRSGNQSSERLCSCLWPAPRSAEPTAPPPPCSPPLLSLQPDSRARPRPQGAETFQLRVQRWGNNLVQTLSSCDIAKCTRFSFDLSPIPVCRVVSIC